MDKRTRASLFNDLRSAEDRIMGDKGEEYSQGSEDVNSNFKVVAGLLAGAKLDDLTVAGVYLLKHVISVCDYIVRRPARPPSGETIEGRIIDGRNYLGIIASIISEHEERDRRGEEKQL